VRRGMRVPIAIIAGALLIAASILVANRYEIGRVGVDTRGFTVWGIDSWTGAPFMRTAQTD
jgi:hypothetical protein